MSVPVIFNYLKAMAEHDASDLYLTLGFPPTIRVDDRIINIAEQKLDVKDLNEILGMVLTNRQRREYETDKELNTSLDMGKYGRFRLNVFRQKQTPGLVIRRVKTEIPSFEELQIPMLLKDLALTKRGLILVTGQTGSGKSTTLAAMLNHRNEARPGHIITIEDPIEYYHEHKKCVVTQREVGVDTENYAVALKNSLRQRPDVVLVGEARDREVMEQALATAETGHLCLSTLHTNNSYQGIERIVNMFPEDRHDQIRASLAMNLRAIISQRLVPTVNGGMTVAMEILINEGLIKDLIEQNKVAKIPEVVSQNINMGMCTFDQSLLNLYSRGLISEEIAIAHADTANDVRLKIQQMRLGNTDVGLTNLDTSRLKMSD
ncbi:MAG: PilT/PilU family type 4a pilus ATPase [Pseudomonadota bacterium]|nr:PilT/PilU family type 4a pilus ATPase [Pseudomonadota bacterium]